MHSSLKDEKIGMILALSKKGMKLGVSGLCEDTQRVHQTETRTVRTAILKFKITCRTESFVEDLKQMGISSLFDERSDLSGMTGGVNKGLYVSQIIHKAVIDVNEHGSEAAAATGMMLRCMALPMMRPQVKVFTLNRPFYFSTDAGRQRPYSSAAILPIHCPQTKSHFLIF